MKQKLNEKKKSLVTKKDEIKSRTDEKEKKSNLVYKNVENKSGLKLVTIST